ncbi:hypothetical protein BDZ89DRAFT_481874 [Hymenopellis radicata]|nr:hypothetical protein BDZ89DRAFT_481874 [Hymenopellis radicata]
MSDNKNPERVAAGLKAAINNPAVGDEARERASERLQNMDVQYTDKDPNASKQGTGDAHTNQVLGGYKATLKNDNAGEEAKAHARDVLDEHGASYEPMSTRKENPDPERVASGYKATMKNPNTSEDVKRNAQEYLEENDEDY